MRAMERYERPPMISLDGLGTRMGGGLYCSASALLSAIQEHIACATRRPPHVWLMGADKH